MAQWTCPKCGETYHSAWDNRDRELIRCDKCGEDFENPYYQDIDALLREHHNRRAI